MALTKVDSILVDGAINTDSSGNVGIGTSSPWSQISSFGVSGATTQYLGFKNADGGDIRFGKASGVDNSCVLGTWAGNSMLFYTNSVERMRVDGSGNLLVGTTTRFTTGGFLPKVTIDAVADGIAIPNIGNGYAGLITKAGGSYNYFAGYFLNSSNSVVGSINCTTSATSYVTSSDYRLKENIAPMTGALAKVALLKPVTYTWKESGEVAQGFIAHELQAVVPDCVVGEKDAVETYIDEQGIEQTKPVYQGIDTSFLVATLTAAIQEQQAIITDLKARIETLEAK
jgi:hypothetical protein